MFEALMRAVKMVNIQFSKMDNLLNIQFTNQFTEKKTNQRQVQFVEYLMG